jgi:enoyl-[acyl-carrier protein] reductase II
VKLLQMTRITKLLSIDIPIIQAGMIWCSPWQLALAVSSRGGLGVIGAGSMYPEVLREHIVKLKAHTQRTFAVNLPLLYPDIESHINTIIKYKVPVVITSAGSPKKFTAVFKEKGIKVIHVVSSTKFAIKSQEAGVDAVVAEGFEAGGHNGREETTTMVLIPSVSRSVDIPVIAAGGIGCGRSMAAAMALGADGVQIGSRFVLAKESSAHDRFKEVVSSASEGDTRLTLKELTPVRLIKNEFYSSIQEAYKRNADISELRQLLGRGRAKKGMFEGDVDEGELEIGQVSANFTSVLSASDIIDEIISEYNRTIAALDKVNVD